MRILISVFNVSYFFNFLVFENIVISQLQCLLAMSACIPRPVFMQQFQCCLCCQHFEEVEELEAHLASVHVLYMAYECDFCRDALFPSDFALREHYLKIHDKKSFVVKYRVSPELEERRKLLRHLVGQSTLKTCGALRQDKTPNLEESNSYTSQLLENCTSLLKTQLMASSRFLNNSIKKVTLLEHNNSFIYNGGGGEIEEQPMEGASFCDRKYSASPDQKKHSFPVNEDNSIFPNANLSPLPMASRAASRNMEQINDTQSEIKVSPIRKFTKRSRKAQNAKNERSQSNFSQGSNEEVKQQKGPMVECSGCKRMVGQYRNSMLIHVSTHHCDQPIFECIADGCGKKWYSISARTKEHIESKHGGNYKFLQDNRTFLLPLLRSTAVRLFQGAY